MRPRSPANRPVSSASVRPATGAPTIAGAPRETGAPFGVKHEYESRLAAWLMVSTLHVEVAVGCCPPGVAVRRGKFVVKTSLWKPGWNVTGWPWKLGKGLKVLAEPGGIGRAAPVFMYVQ